MSNITEPRYSQEYIQQYIQLYKMNPSLFQKGQVNTIKSYAEYYKMPFAEDEIQKDFSLLNAVKQAGEGYLSGFTTFDVGKASTNPTERIFRSVGQLAGFIGWLPGLGPKLLAKLGLNATSTLYRMLHGAQALSKYGATSVPMFAAKRATKAASKIASKFAISASTSQAKALSTVGSFLIKELPKDVASGAFHLGAASAVSSWQHGVDEMVKSFVGGSVTGGSFKLLGNVFGKYGLINPGSESARKALNVTAFSMYSGLPTTLQGQTAPEQVYGYLLGAYFGYGANTSANNAAMSFVKNVHSPDVQKTGRLRTPEEFPQFQQLSVGAQEVAKRTITNIHLPRMTKSLTQHLAKELGMDEIDVNRQFANDIQAAINKKFVSPLDKEGPQKPLVEILGNRFKVAVEQVFNSYTQSMNNLTVSSEIKDVNNYSHEENVNTQMKGFLEQYSTTKEIYNPANTNHVKALTKLQKKWNSIQKYGQKKNNSEKMVEWLKTQEEFNQEDISSKEVTAFWRKQAAEKIAHRKMKLYGFDKLGNLYPVNKDDRTAAGTFRAEKRIPETLDHIVRTAYKIHTGKEFTDEAVAYVEHSIDRRNESYMDGPLKKWTSRNRIGKVTDVELSDGATSRIFDSFNKKNMYYYSGVGDKTRFKFVKYHPDVLKMEKDGTVNSSYELIKGEIARSLSDKPKDIGKVNSKLKGAENRFLTHYKGNKQKGMLIYQKSVLSNVYYDMLRNGTTLNSKDFLKTTLSSNTDFINTVKAFNKREQIWSTDALPVDTAYVKKITGRKDLRIAILNDYRAKTLGVDSTALSYGETTDGVFFVLPEYLKAGNESIGMPSEGNMGKPFVASANKKHGAFLGKTFFFTPPKALEDYMRANGLEGIAYKSAAKQIGTREAVSLNLKKVTGKDKSIEMSFVDKQKLFADKSKRGVYSIPLEDVRFVTTKAIDHHYLENAGIPSQMYSNLSPLSYSNMDPTTIKDFFDNTVGRSVTGVREWNDRMNKYLVSGGSKRERKTLLNNLDKIGVTELFRAIHGKQNKDFSIDLLASIYKLHRRNMVDDIQSLEENPFDGINLLKQGAEFPTAADKILHGTNLGRYSFIDPAINNKYGASVINGYVRTRLTKPKIGNSFQAVMRPYTVFDALNLRLNNLNKNDSIFYLGDKFGAKIITDSRLPNGKMTLKAIWKSINNKKIDVKTRKVMEEIINDVAVTRAPIESASGVQQMVFGGFNGYEDYSIMLHGRTMQALGGADLDGDTAFAFFGGDGGMNKEWVKLFGDQKKEYYHTKDGRTSTAPEDSIDPVTGKTYLSAKVITGGHISELMNDPVLKYDPYARRIASQQAYRGREVLGRVVNSRHYIVASYNELMNKPKNQRKFEYIFTDPKTGEKTTITQRPKEGQLDRILKSTAASAKAAIDPMDYDGILTADQMITHDLDVAYNFTAKNAKGESINPATITPEMKKAGVTSLFGQFKQAMRGQNSYEGRPFTQLEKWIAAKRLSFEFPEAVTTMPLQAEHMAGFDLNDSIFKRTSTEEINSLYQHFYLLNVEKGGGDFGPINNVVGSKSKENRYSGRKVMPVKKHGIIRDYTKYNLANIDVKQHFIEDGSTLARDILTSNWYKKLSKKIPELVEYGQFKEMNVKQRASALKSIDIIAEDFLTNDLKDMSSMIMLSRMVKENKMKSYSIKKAWNASLKVKELNERGYREEGKTLDRNELLAKSDELALKFKQKMTPAESQLFDGFMLSPMRGNGKTLTSSQALEMNSTNMGVVDIFFNIQDKLYTEMTSGTFKKESAQDLNNLVQTEKNKSKLINNENLNAFKIDEQKDIFSGIKVDKNASPQLKGRAKRVHDRLTSFVDNTPTFNTFNDLNSLSLVVNGKPLNALTMVGYENLANVVDNIRAGGGSFLAKAGSEAIKKQPQISRAFYHLFPRKVGEKLMKYGVQFKKKLAPYRDKDGNVHMMGIGKTPTHLIIENQNFADYAARMATKLEQKATLAITKELTPLMHSDRALDVWEAMVATRVEQGMIKITSGDHMIAYAENARKYHKLLRKMGDMKHTIVGKGGKKEFVTSEQLMDKMQAVHTKVMKTVDSWHRGKKGYLDNYMIPKYLTKGKDRIDVNLKWKALSANQLDANAWYNSMVEKGWKPSGTPIMHNKTMPVYNYKAFLQREIVANEALEKSINLDIGAHNFRLIEHSMQLSTNMHREKAFIENLMRTQPKEPGSLEGIYHPHNNYNKKIMTKEKWKSISAILKRTDISNEQKIKEAMAVSARAYSDILLATKESVSDELWKVLGPEMNKVVLTKNERRNMSKWWESFLISGHERKRKAHTPGWDLGPDALTSYVINESKQFMRHVAQLGIRNGINEMYYTNKGKMNESTLTSFIDFYRMQAQNALGFPQIIPESVLTNPELKVKNTLYSYWADNVVSKKLNKIAEKLHIMAPQVTPESSLTAIEARMKSWKFDEMKLAYFSNLEAKYQMAALLAHPKVSVNNIYGGTLNTIIGTGIKNFTKSQSLKALQELNPDWDSWEKINRFVVQSGVIEEFMIYQAGVTPRTRVRNWKAFQDDAIKAITKNPNLKDADLMGIARKHRISEGIVNSAAWFMKVSERKLRKDAFLSHLIQAHNNWDGTLPYNHPFLIKSALSGVRATQFLYSAPFRPMFSNTALGKVMTRFQLWSWNSVRMRNDIIKQASIYGYRQGTEQFDRFKRMAQADLMVVALSNVFMYSLFESALPAPYSWMQDFADALFGDEKERERAFFGAYPGALAPLQLITPSALRLVGPTMSAFIKDDFSEISSYHIWSAFPFGRMGRDLIGPGNVFVNPSGIIEKTTGIPYRGMQEYRKKLEAEQKKRRG